MSTSSSPTQNALSVEIKPSAYFFVALALVTAGALAAIFYAQLTPLQSILAVVGACAYAAYCVSVQRRQRGVLAWRSGWKWRDAKNIETRLQLRQATVWSGLIVLRFADRQRRRERVFTLFADSFFVADDARRLRVRLLHFPVFESNEAFD